MKQDHRTSFGRHNTAVPVTQRPRKDDTGLHDKWQLLTALTDAAADFGLNHRSLSVLRALMSFHPDRMIAPTPLSSIVFPANQTLSERLGGMPESTLRRHLAALVASGLVSRHDSANRKRFARGRAGQGRLAFGFDLSPIARMSAQITARAQAAQDVRAALQSLRAELAALRQHIIEGQGPCEQTEEAFRLLRRKPDGPALQAAIDRLTIIHETFKTSSSDSQNERHIQTESKILSERETNAENDTPSFEDVVTQCSEYQSFFPEPVHSWQDLSRVAHALAPMMGIEANVYAQALHRMGPKRAIISILCILECLKSIGNPGGYLRRLVQQDVAGQLDLFFLLNKTTKGNQLPIVS